MRHRTFGALLIGFAVLAGPTTGPAHGKDAVDIVREAHARHVRMIKKAHARHVRVLHKVEAAHERHVSHAPRPVRKVHHFVVERHRAHMRALGRAERFVERRHAAHERDVSGALSVVQRRHREHVRTVGLEKLDSDVASVGASAGASVERAHRRHVGALERLADWLVGA